MEKTVTLQRLATMVAEQSPHSNQFVTSNSSSGE